MQAYDFPWQVTSSQLITYALEHAERDTDFDKQIAYLLLDVGIETVYKIFLFNHAYSQFKEVLEDEKRDTREVSFYKLIQSVKKAAGKKIQNIDIDQTNYFHNLRNQLYHQGDGVTPTSENLQRYLSLAKTLLKVLLDVDIEESKDNHSPFSLARIQKNITSLQSNSSLIVEHLYPKIATRKIEAQLRHIRTFTGPDDESYPPLVKAEFRHQRIDAFNKITGWEFTYDEEHNEEGTGDYVFVEYIIDNPEQLHVWIAFQEISSDDWLKDWREYQRTVYFLEHEQVKDSKTEYKRYEEMYDWTHEKAGIIYQWVKAHIPDVEPKGTDWYWEKGIFD